MKITFPCTGCGRALKARPDSVGRTRKCPVCATRVSCTGPVVKARPAVEEVIDAEIVEAEVVPASRPVRAAAKPAPAARRWASATGPGRSPASNSSADVDDDPYQLAGPDPAAAPAAEARTPCPMCGEMIVATAAKCRFCGEVFDPTLKKAKKSRRYGPDDENLTSGDVVVAVLCSGIGCIAGIVWMIQGKPKGGKMLAISFAMNVVWGLVRVALQTAVERGGP